MAIAWGIKRGIYSNEAGQGTAPHAAAAAEVSHPAKQGLVQAFSVYVDTLFVCTATAFMILFTGKYNVLNPEGGMIVANIPTAKIGAEYTQYAVAETNLSYLDKSGNKIAVWVLRFLLLFATFYGSIKTAEAAWTLGDIGVGVMAWLNVIAILILRKPALKSLKDYQEQRKAGKDPVFDAKKLGIKNTEEW